MAADVSKQLDRAKRYLERNKLEEAAEAYQSALSEMPGNLEALQALGDLYTRLGQPGRAANSYSLLFDRFFDAHEENKALAIYTRVLKGVQQPGERMVRYAVLLQKQNRSDEAIEQYSLASELFLAKGKEEAALDCLERLAQLDPESSARQLAIAELAQRLGKNTVAARGFLRTGQLLEAAGDRGAALEMLARAHQLVPKERGPALVYAQALLRQGDAQATVELLEPLSAGEQDASFLSVFGEALARSGALDRARSVLDRLPAERSERVTTLFDLADRYVALKRDNEAVALLRDLQKSMVALGGGNDFAARLDGLAENHSDSIAVSEFRAGVYAQMNRETKYFEALAPLFDLYVSAGNFPRACETFDKLVDIDPYDPRSPERIKRLENHADAAFLSRMRNRLGQVATHSADAARPAENSPGPKAAEARSERQPLEDLIVQAEIFLQYSLQSKAVERLQRIAELFPGEEKQNHRLRNLFQLANWWPSGTSQAAAPALQESPEPVAPVAASAGESGETLRDLGKISEISHTLFRLASAQGILSAGVNEIGHHLRAQRCIGVIGTPGKPPQVASEFCAPGKQPVSGATLARVVAQLEHAAPDALGGIPLEAATAPVLRELGIEAAVGVLLIDRETQEHAGVILAGYEKVHAWRPHESYFLQAVGDQILLGVNHTRLRTLARTVGVADEQTGLVARGSYQECLIAEANRAKSQGSALALVLMQIDRGPELLRQHGEAPLERHVQQLARAFEGLVRQTDIAVKYNSWTIAFILPGTGLAGAQELEGKLRKASAQVRPSWEDGVPLTTSASLAEAAARPDYDVEDIVTEMINRAEEGLEEARNRGGDAVVALTLQRS
jgi:diguanylate cyclase (GGDEF)-like protein